MTRTCQHIAAALMFLALAGAGERAWAVDYHVGTAQALQNALTEAAGNGSADVIYLTNGYYTGNFNFSSDQTNGLTLQAEQGLANDQVIIDGANIGRGLNLSFSTNAPITVRGVTFLRNCGGGDKAALRLSTGIGNGANVLVEECQFLSPTNKYGMGLEIAAAKNTTVRRCVVIGIPNNYGGRGIYISGTAGNVIVEESNVATNSGGGLYIDNSANIMVRSNNFTGNPGGVGGGASCAGTLITIEGNTFTQNSSSGAYWSSGGGGGVYCLGTATLAGNTFIGNSASGWQYSHGGGALCSGGTATLTANIFKGNSAARGGGVYCSGGVLTSNTFTGNWAGGNSVGGGGAVCGGGIVSGNTFIGNSAGGDNGGGLHFGDGLISDNIFTFNSASYGGAVFHNGNVLTLTRNTMKQNTATTGGGGYVVSTTVKFLDNLVVKNSQTGSGSTGGGIFLNVRTSLDMINNTIFGNTATGNGGGVAFQVDGVTETLHIYNNVIWGNSANGSGTDVHLAGTGLRKEFLFNNAHGMSGLWDVAQNNLDVDPQFFDAINGEYHLRPASLCVNAGTNGAPSLPATDLDGDSRIAGGTVDLGCYEFSNTACHPADSNSDWVISEAEFTTYAAAWKNAQPWTNGPSPIPANYVTRAGYLKQNGGRYHNDSSTRPTNWKPGM